MFGNRLPWTLLASLAIIGNACGFNAETTAETATEHERTYLTEPIPPCVPTISEPDPCPVDLPPTQENTTGSLASFISPVAITSFTERLVYDPEKHAGNSSHIVVRGIVKTNTTRCEIYRIKISERRAQRLQNLGILPVVDQYIVGRYHYSCFADVAVKEYIVGNGPPTLTVVLSLIYARENRLDYLGNVKEKYLEFYGDPEKRAISYEGKEIIFFLGPSPSLAVEAWAGLGGYNMWFLQQTDQGIRAVAQNIWRATGIEEIRKTLDRPLDEMVADIKQAAINREAITGGRIGIDPDLPMLITDAHNLRDYYTSVGAVYDDTENATVLPPPVPGEDDPAAPTLPVNDGTTVTTVPVPGEETTAPPTTDDAGLSVEQTTTTTTEPTTTSSTTTTDIAPTTTEVPNGESSSPPVDDTVDEEEQTLASTSTLPSDDDNTTTTTVSPIEEQTTTTNGAPPLIDGEDPDDETIVPPPADDDTAPPADDGIPEADPAPGRLPADETTS